MNRFIRPSFVFAAGLILSLATIALAPKGFAQNAPQKAPAAPIQAQAPSPLKTALVVGSASTLSPFTPLSLSDDKAAKVASALKSKGYQVTLLIDPDAQTLSSAIGDWLKRSGQGAYRFFYYAGHVVQTPKDSLLAPKGVEIRDGGVRNGISVPYVLNFLDQVPARANYIVIEACVSEVRGASGLAWVGVKQTRSPGRAPPRSSLALINRGGPGSDAIDFAEALSQSIGAAGANSLDGAIAEAANEAVDGLADPPFVEFQSSAVAAPKPPVQVGAPSPLPPPVAAPEPPSPLPAPPPGPITGSSPDDGRPSPKPAKKNGAAPSPLPGFQGDPNAKPRISRPQPEIKSDKSDAATKPAPVGGGAPGAADGAQLPPVITPILVLLRRDQQPVSAHGGYATIVLSARTQDFARNRRLCEAMFQGLTPAPYDAAKAGAVKDETGKARKARPAYWMVSRQAQAGCLDLTRAYDLERASKIRNQFDLTRPGPYLVVQRADEKLASVIDLTDVAGKDFPGHVDFFRYRMMHMEDVWASQRYTAPNLVAWTDQALRKITTAIPRLVQAKAEAGGGQN